MDTPITVDDQHSISSLTSLRHCSHGDDVTGNCRLANCDKTSRVDRGRERTAIQFHFFDKNCLCKLQFMVAFQWAYVCLRQQ